MRVNAGDNRIIFALVANLDRAADVPVNQTAALLASLASEQARLAAVQGVLMTRLLASQSTVTDESVDQLLTAEDVAQALGVTRRWVQRRARDCRSRVVSQSTRFAIPNRA